MIITKEIKVILNSSNLKRYESLGYKILRYYHSHNGWGFKRGTIIKINIKDLPPKSSIKVFCKCDNCGKEKLIRYYSIKRKDGKYFCHKCSMGTFEVFQKLSKSHLNKNISREERRINRSRGLLIGYNNWIKKVQIRDNYTCQKCGSKEKLRTHHIESWVQNKIKRIDINNGITLCEKCHKEFHKIYGLKNFSKNELKDFLKFIPLSL